MVKRLLGVALSAALAVAVLFAALAPTPGGLERTAERLSLTPVLGAQHAVLASSLPTPDTGRHVLAAPLAARPAPASLRLREPAPLSLAHPRPLLRWCLAHSTASGLH